MAGFSFIGSPAFLFVGMGVFDIFADVADLMQLRRLRGAMNLIAPNKAKPEEAKLKII